MIGMNNCMSYLAQSALKLQECSQEYYTIWSRGASAPNFQNLMLINVPLPAETVETKFNGADNNAGTVWNFEMSE